MKKILSIMSALALLSMSMMVSSCGFDDDNTIPDFISAVVTVKYDTSDKCFFQVNKETIVYPTNVHKPYGGKEVRALTQYRMKDDPQQVEVFYLDSIRTKSSVPTLGTDDNKTYGFDPINVLGDWCTVAEDGYITVHFTTFFSGLCNHYINLVSGVNPDDPFEFDLRHDAKGDIAGTIAEGYVAFNIKEFLPEDTSDVIFTINYLTYEGKKTFKLKYER